MENKISDHYQNCQIMQIKKAHLIPALSSQEREENVPPAIVRYSEEDSRRLHGKSLPQQQIPHLAQRHKPLSSSKPKDVFGGLTFGFTFVLFCFNLSFCLCLNIHISKGLDLI